MSIVSISVTPVCTLAVYDAADAVGGMLTFANAASVYRGTGKVVRVALKDNSNQKANLRLWLYNQTFTAAADHAAFDPTDADNLNCLGCIDIPVANYMTATDNSVASVDCDFPFVLVAGGTSLFGQLQAVAAAPDLVAVDDITVTLTIER